MATRSYEFTGSLIDTSTLPAVSNASADADVPNYGQTARRSSWYDRKSGVAGIRAIVAADRSDGQIVYNSGNMSFYEFVAGDTNTDDGDQYLEPDDDPTAPAGRWTKVAGGGAGGGTSGSIVYQYDTEVATIRAGESISNRDTVAVVQFDQDGFLVMKAENDQPRFKESFKGIAKAAATVTQGVYTLTADAAFVTGNVISFDVNGIPYSITFSSSSDETLQAIATAIAAHQDVDAGSTDSVQVGADKLGSDDRVINIYSGNGRNAAGAVTILIDNISVTGGASQPNFTFATTTTADGDPVSIHRSGHLGGMTGLTVGTKYFLSDTAGALTSIDPGNGILVGSATSTTAIDVELKKDGHAFNPILAGLERFWEVGGNNSNAAGTIFATLESYGYVSWNSDSPVITTAREFGSNGNQRFRNLFFCAGGRDTAGTMRAIAEQFDTISWTSAASMSASRAQGNTYEFLGRFLYAQGLTTWGTAASGQATIFGYNGTSWATDFTLSGSRYAAGIFPYGGLLHIVGGVNTGSANTSTHFTYDGSSEGSSTAFPVSQYSSASGLVNSDAWVVAGNSTSIDDGYKWSGSWGSAITYPAALSQTDIKLSQGCKISGGNFMTNGRNSTGTTASNETYRFDGTSITADTSSVTSRYNASSTAV